MAIAALPEATSTEAKAISAQFMRRGKLAPEQGAMVAGRQLCPAMAISAEGAYGATMAPRSCASATASSKRNHARRTQQQRAAVEGGTRTGKRNHARQTQ
jgi:hypothetical protein